MMPAMQGYGPMAPMAAMPAMPSYPTQSYPLWFGTQVSQAPLFPFQSLFLSESAGLVSPALLCVKTLS